MVIKTLVSSVGFENCRLKCGRSKVQTAFTSPARVPLRPVASVPQEAARTATCEIFSGAMKARNNALQRTSAR